MKAKRKTFIFAVAPSVAVLLLVSLGFFVGRYTIVRSLTKEIRYASQASTLGGLLNDEQKRETARAYYGSDQVVRVIDTFSWSVPTMPTPFVGVAPIPGQHGNSFINSEQFRADREIVMPKPSGVYRIFVTGGSTAYGTGAPSQDRTIAGYLVKLLAMSLSPLTELRYEVFTLACPAWASTHERIIIENRLSELEPDMIICFSGNNDVHWGQMGRNILWFRTFAEKRFFDVIRKVCSYTDQPHMPEGTEIEDGGVAPAIVAQRLVKNVRLGFCALSGQKTWYVFALQPTLPITGKSLTKREKHILHLAKKHFEGFEEYFKECYARIDVGLRSLQEEKYRYINLSGVFDGIGDQEEIFVDSYHFGDKGNEIIAQQLFSRIKEMVLDEGNRQIF